MTRSSAPRSSDKARHAERGDRRRVALLESLDACLRESGFESINVAEISRRAGVTRSAFYFYFENKATAVAALVQEMYEEAFAATDILTGSGDPASRITSTIRALFEAWERHEYVYRAMLEARASSQAVRDMWDSDRQSFVPAVAGMIAAEREAGRAPDGPEATALAATLLELNDRTLERLAMPGPLGRDQILDTVTTIWLRSIYGSEPRRSHHT